MVEGSHLTAPQALSWSAKLTNQWILASLIRLSYPRWACRYRNCLFSILTADEGTSLPLSDGMISLTNWKRKQALIISTLVFPYHQEGIIQCEISVLVGFSCSNDSMIRWALLLVSTKSRRDHWGHQWRVFRQSEPASITVQARVGNTRCNHFRRLRATNAWATAIHFARHHSIVRCFHFMSDINSANGFRSFNVTSMSSRWREAFGFDWTPTIVPFQTGLETKYGVAEIDSYFRLSFPTSVVISAVSASKQANLSIWRRLGSFISEWLMFRSSLKVSTLMSSYDDHLIRISILVFSGEIIGDVYQLLSSASQSPAMVFLVHL